jgi:hypothetical protein
MADTYEIRRSGEILCASSVPNLGYSKETLRDMERAGLHLYRNGKREKAASRGANTESGRPK